MSVIKPSLDFFEPHQRLKIKRHFDVDQVSKVFVHGIDQLGGLMFSSPFFRELRRAFPNAYIVNMVGSLTYPIMQNCPYVDEVWLFNKSESWATMKKIKAAGFDLAFLATGNLRSALIAYLAGIPNRVGFDNDGTGRFLTVQMHQEFHSRYRPENMFDYLRAIGISPQGVYDREVWVSEEDKQYAVSWFESHNSEQKLFVFNPFSTDPKRQWTDEGWKETLKQVIARGIKPIMLVGKNEVEQGKVFLSSWQLPNIEVESHSVTQTAAILHYVDFVVGPDSGFIHMALAVNKPHVIGLFNVVPPISCFPIHNHDHIALIEDQLDCCPCYLYKAKDVCPNELKCMTSLKAEKVLQAIDHFSLVKLT
ncbi:glycosyltransferase family 9 protein [Hydrogenovibrio kuenenii]|uniref:glycosyltransferase family 9 protein n=1 Tax=Hydrogenovibrio kuenenii TaxID=63658 RepID=UPI00046660AC|nr:glycosyltransferase family 9 protein [Hydrogenovibrio kuenenii]